MRLAAYTSLGRNALSAGLVSHIAALLAGMMPVSGAQTFFYAAYGFACLMFGSGAYTELKDRGFALVGFLGLIFAAAAAAVPVIGPVAVVLMLYAVQGKRRGERFTLLGLLASIPRLKINPLVLFFFLTILFILFALTILQRDPYFKQRAKTGKVSSGHRPAVLVYCRDACTPETWCLQQLPSGEKSISGTTVLT